MSIYQNLVDISNINLEKKIIHKVNDPPLLKHIAEGFCLLLCRPVFRQAKSS